MSSPLQIVLQGTPKNDTVADALTKYQSDVKSNEPGTLDWRAFRQEDGTICFLDVYESSEAFTEHFGRARDSGFLDTLMGSVDFKSVLVMGEPTTEARGILDQLGAVYAKPISGFSRIVPTKTAVN